MGTLVQEKPAGLTAAQAAARLATDGPNTVARPKPRRLVLRLWDQLTDPLVLLLLAATVVTLILRDWADTAVILLVIILNTAIGVAQQIRADRAITALDDLAAPVARVIRDGTDQRIAAAGLVRGDLVQVEAGDIVPADLLLQDAHRCQTNEAALTGESVPVGHHTGGELQAGTVVVTGRALGVVRRTGADSSLGRIAHLVTHASSGPTPLQRRLSGLSKTLGAGAVALCLVVFAVGVAGGQPLLSMALVAVSLVVAAVPESLPAVVTLALALGARRMARHKAIPRNLHAVETLGSVTVIASDKTGTLTEGRMSVSQAQAGEIPYTARGSGYAPDGLIEPAPTPQLLALARAALLCSDATVTPPTEDSPEWTAIGDPMEACLIAFAARCGLDPQQVRDQAPRIAEFPFDQETRKMTTIHRVPGAHLTVCKGAPEAVLATPVVRFVPQAAVTAARTLAEQGMRVIAVAAGTSAQPGSPSAPSGLDVLGVIGITDPLREAAGRTVESIAQAGIRLILITGDHPATAAVIGAQLGIWQPGDPVGSGSSNPDHTQDVRVFARIQPEQKLSIISGLQHQGHVVAMTGDGVNDAPALRRADIGVAMGSGTEAARQAAGLVLLDDNLATVTTAIGEGRRVYDNIRRFLLYALSGGAAEILVMLVGPLLGMAVPLLPGQILWINLLTHGLPGVALGAEPAEPDVLRRPPRSPGEQVLGAGLWRGILLLGTFLTVATLAAGLLAINAGWPWQSMVFVTLGLTQLGLALAVRVPGPARQNPGLLAAVALSATAQVAAVLFAPLRVLLGTQQLSLPQLGVCAGVALLPAAGLWLHNRLRWRR
jgi:Ca2+-transporting ATPase